jgi:hypothetical protein
MKHSDFALGTVFWSSNQQWRCTDVGSRAIVAIRIDAAFRVPQNAAQNLQGAPVGRSKNLRKKKTPRKKCGLV